MWTLLVKGLPTQGKYKKFYDKQRRATEDYKERDAKRKRQKYKKDPAPQLQANQRYKERFIAEHGLDAWRERYKKYRETFKAKHK